MSASHCCLLFVAPVLATALTYPIVDTDQTKFYNGLDVAASTPTSGQDYFGQDGHYCGNTPSYSYVDATTKTMVLDGVTGLTWTSSQGSRTNFDGAAAAATACSAGGFSDWRVPTTKELFSLWLASGTDPSNDAGTHTAQCRAYIDTQFFGFEYGDGTALRDIDGQGATTTTYVDTSATMPEFFGVNVADGRIKGYPKTPSSNNGNQFFTYFVRGATTYGVNSFTDNGDGTITDAATGLMWSKKDSRATETATNSLSGAGPVDWKSALAACEALTLATHSDWRLPNIKELHSIVDYSRSPGTSSSPAIDANFETSTFTNEYGSVDFPYFWSSTTQERCIEPGGSGNLAEHAWYIAFGRGVGMMNNVGMDVHGAGALRSDPKQQVSSGTTSAEDVEISLTEATQTPTIVIPASVRAQFQQPVDLPHKISNQFGPRWKTSQSRYDFHIGMDMWDANNVDIYSIGAGDIDRVYPDGSSSAGGGGNTVRIKHTLAEPILFHGQSITRLYSVYLHLDSIASGIVEGGTVTKGQVLGAMGQTGSTTFTHLHFETRLGTSCGLTYQIANPASSCASYGFEPKINPLFFLPHFSNNLGTAPLTKSLGTGVKAYQNAARKTATLYIPSRDMLHLNRIQFGSVDLDFSLYTGFDATDLDVLDAMQFSWGKLIPMPFSSTSTSINVTLEFNDATALDGPITWTDIWGNSVVTVVPGNPDYPANHGPQGDYQRGKNYYRCVRGGTATAVSTTCPATGNPLISGTYNFDPSATTVAAASSTAAAASSTVAAASSSATVATAVAGGLAPTSATGATATTVDAINAAAATSAATTPTTAGTTVAALTPAAASASASTTTTTTAAAAATGTSSTTTTTRTAIVSGSADLFSYSGNSGAASAVYMAIVMTTLALLLSHQ